MRHLLKAARVITPDEGFSPGWVLLRDDKIEGVGPGEAAPDGLPTTDLGTHTLAPGFVDVHVHGGGGFSLLTGEADEIRGYRRWAPSTGVTSLLPTVCAASLSEAEALIRALAGQCGQHDGAAELLGINLEGPFVSPARLGALPSSWAQPPDRAVLQRLLEAASDNLRLITMAPELPGEAVMADALAAGVRVSLGHTNADTDAGSRAFESGASHVTHALNAMRPFHQRDPGVIGAALAASGVTIEVIADGVHLHPDTVRLLIRAFGPGRVALVTDAVKPAGLASGSSRIGAGEAVLSSGRVSLPDGTLAGGASTMATLVKNVVSWGTATLDEAVRMASTVPAAVAGASERKGRIAGGYDADLVALTPELEVAATWTGGRLAYSSPALPPPNSPFLPS